MSNTPTSSSSHVLIGKHGADEIRARLAKDNPKTVIEAFQEETSLSTNTTIPNLSFKLFDLHGMKRSTIHKSLLLSLRSELLERIGEIGEESLSSLLSSTFPYIGFEELRPVAIAVMKRHPSIPRPFLEQLAANPTLYQECPLSVKQQIWTVDEGLFRQEVFPLLNQYIEAFERHHPAFDYFPAPHAANPKQR